MAVHEHIVLPMYKDQNGDTHLLYAITNVDCIDGLEELLATVATHEHSNKEVLDKIASTVDIYTQADEPVDAIDGSIWFNTGNADGTISILVRRNGSWEISSDGVAQVQPDWEQTDASNPGYVRNKPFGYTADLYVNSTLPFAVGTNKNNIYSASLPAGLFSSLKAGDNVTVVWDGTVYEITAKRAQISDFLSCSNLLGNGRILSELYGANLATDTGEPFAIIPAFNIICTRSTMSTHSLQIKDDETIIKIDAKFLPDEALKSPVQSDWNETDESSDAFIANKPEIPSTDGFATTEYVDRMFAEVVGGSFEQVQANWDQVDASKPDYIANRPFGLGPDLLNDSALTFSLVGAGDTGITARDTIYRASVSTNSWDINDGDVLTIMWDGETKEYAANRVAINESVSTDVIGNAYIASLFTGAASGYIAENTYEPFCIMPATNYFLTLSSASTHSVRINKTDEIKKIDIRYLPDEALLSPVQADWNVTGEDDPAFIKNKPEIPSVEGLATESYVDEKIREINVQGGVSGPVSWDDIEDKPFGEIVTQTDVLPMSRFEDFTLDPTYNLYTTVADGNRALTVGEEYKISWDGQEYSCEALDVSQAWDGLPIVAMGNGTAFGYPGNSEPFIIMCNTDNDFITLVCMSHSEPCEYHDVRIYQETSEIKKIDAEFLPDDIGGDVLPEVTAEDNGKVLGVVDGEWKKIAVGGDGSVAVQPDWNQSDDSAADYIKNRPFYDYKGEVDIVPNRTCDSFTLDSSYNVYTSAVSGTISLIPGQSYKVLWDGNEFECEATEVTGDLAAAMPGSIIIGNGPAFGLAGNDAVPFIIGTSEILDATVYISLTDTSEGVAHEIWVWQEITLVMKIDTRYLPDDIGGGSSLPEVTTDDVGKFLRVSSAGTWVAESIQNAEEASF